MIISRLSKNPFLNLKKFCSNNKYNNHSHDVELWRRVSLYVCIPAIAITTVYAYIVETEHAKHPRPEFIPYEYLGIHKKDYQWGDGKHSLFFNPVRNATSAGYEIPDPNAGKSHH